MIYLTGSSGFIGRAIFKNLEKNNLDVTKVLSPGRRKNNQKNTIEYKDFLNQSCPAENASHGVLVHCGWKGVAGKDRNDVSQFDNIADSVALFDAALNQNFSHFILIGSQAEFIETSEIITEETDICPSTRYGLAKALCYNSLEYFQRLKGKNILTHAIVFDVYGPSDNPNWLIPSLIKKLCADEVVHLTSCEQIWNYLHVDDLASAILALIHYGPAGLVNICSDYNLPLKDFVMSIALKLKKEELLKFNSVTHHSAARSINGDNKKLKKLTGWEERINFDVGIQDLLKRAELDDQWEYSCKEINSRSNL